MSSATALLADDSRGGPATRSAPGAEGQRPDDASAASALGSTQSYCFTPESAADGTTLRGADPAERRRVRWAGRALLWQASSLKSVRCCGRMLHNDAVGDPDDGQGVVIQRREVDGRMVASCRGLMTCGSVWACPRCSAVIAHTRAEEVAAGVRECYRRGGKVYLLTLTMRHSSRDQLADLWNALSSGWRTAFGQRSWTGQRSRTEQRRGSLVEIAGVMGDAERFDVAGLTRVVEATYGAPTAGGHGWHLHVHALVFSASSMTSGLAPELPAWFGDVVDREWLARNLFASRIHSRWATGLHRAGYQLPGAVAVDVREVADQGAEYIGRYLAKATYDAAAKMGAEIATGQLSKTSRGARNRTPFEVLADLSNSVDARGFGVRTPRHWSVVPARDGDWAVIDTDTGEVLSVTPPGEWRVWHEWEQASKGRRQIMWSKKRRNPTSDREQIWNAVLAVRGLTADESDESVAATDMDGDCLGQIRRSDWYRIVAWRPTLIVEVLEAAESLGVQEVARVLASCGVVFVEHPPPGLRAA